MPNELTVFDGLTPSKRIPEADELEQYYRIHAELCCKYKAEIEYIFHLLHDLREERIDFEKNQIPEICKKLKESLVSQAAIENWIAQLKDDTERSLRASEEFLRGFYVAKLEDFEKELRERLRKV